MRITSVYLAVLLLSSTFILIECRGINGGLGCAVCTILAGIFSQVAEIRQGEIIVDALRNCDRLVWPTNDWCKSLVNALEPALEQLFQNPEITPDTFCYGMKFCRQDKGADMCHLFPPPKSPQNKKGQLLIQELSQPFFKKLYGHRFSFQSKISICDLPFINKYCEDFDKLSQMKPISDDDGDFFSSEEHGRGSNWRGKDCNDKDASVYPGKRPSYADILDDSNCNGIWGLDVHTGIPWETQLCGFGNQSTSRGLIVLGDSVGAHFHFPEIWFNPRLITFDTFFANSSGVLLDELDWPQHGFATGHKNISLPLLIQGETDSIYLRMLERNLCNHRDYQNVCRNGVSSFELVEYVKNIVRRPADRPATVLLGVFGNDVCNRFPNTLQNMTTPSQFRKNVLSVLETLNSNLPTGSLVILFGLVDGTFLYDALAHRAHPLGELHNNIKYQNVFEWFECMQIGPCNGYMSSNSTVRRLTAKRAVELTNVLQIISAEAKFSNIKVSFIPSPLKEVVYNWRQSGGEDWQILEAVDAFHPNQLAQPLITEVVWKYLKRFAPEAIGPINPNNKRIRELFGDQGGH